MSLANRAETPSGVLQTGKPGQRARAVQALALSTDPQATAGLVMACQDPCKWVRLTAALAIGDAKNERAADLLCRLLRDPEWRVREAAARSLQKIHCPQAVPLLRRALTRDPSARVRMASARALVLAGYGDCAIPALKDPLKKVKVAAVHATGMAHQGCARLLGLALRHSIYMVRWAAAQSLVVHPRPEMWRSLLRRLRQETSSEILYALSDALIPIGRSDQRITRALIRTVRGNYSPTARGIAARTLGRIGNPAAVSSLLGALADPSLYVQQKALQALMRIGPSAARIRGQDLNMLFWTIQTTQNPQVRRAALRVAANLEGGIRTLVDNFLDWPDAQHALIKTAVGNPEPVLRVVSRRARRLLVSHPDFMREIARVASAHNLSPEWTALLITR